MAHAQITLDGSLGGPRGVLQGPNVVIPSTVGSRRGSNLFHSFGQFNLAHGESATFTGPTSIANIISRVTGGTPSMIDGAIRSQIPRANLFLLNPSGVLFGPNASLDVSGSLHVSTADYLRLADGTVFASHTALPSTLSVAPPAAFGFLASTPAPIGIVGSTLRMPPGATLSLVGGDIAIGPAGSQHPRLTAAGGRLSLASVAAVGEVGFNAIEQAPALPHPTLANLGHIHLLNARLDVSGTSGGRVVIRGGHLMMDSGAITADTQGDSAGARLGIDIGMRQEAVFTNGAGVVTSALGGGRAGDIRIAANTVEVSNFSLLSVRTFPSTTGASGDLSIASGGLQVRDGALLSTATGGTGRGGALHIDADTLDVTGGASLFSTTLGAGQGGNIGITTGTLMLSGGARLSSQASEAGAGGDVMITATTAVVIAGHDASGNVSGMFNTALGSGRPGTVYVSAPHVTLDGGFLGMPQLFFGAGHTGDITVETARLRLTNGGHITSFTDGAMAGGTVMVTATEAISIAAVNHTLSTPSAINSHTTGSGAGGRLSVAAPTLTLTDLGAIVTGTTGSGSTGDLMVEVGRLTLNHGQISSLSPSGVAGVVTITAREAISAQHSAIGSATGTGTGDSGRVFVATPTLMLDGGQIITTTSLLGQSGSGRPGDIVLEVGQLTLMNGAQIRSTTQGAGRGGHIMVTATEAIIMAGVPGSASGLVSGTSGAGNAGSILVSAPVITMQGAGMEATTVGEGRAGDIMVHAGRLSLAGGSALLSNSGIIDEQDNTLRANGAAGNIAITTTEVLTLTEGSRVSSSTLGGAGGQILITAPVLDLTDGQITAITLGDSKAGDIDLRVGRLHSRHAEITSASGREFAPGQLVAGVGAAGSVTITATETVALTEGSLLSTATLGGEGGRIALTTPVVELNGSTIVASTAGDQRAGSIDLQAGRLTLETGAGIFSTSGVPDSTGSIRFGSGAAGNVNVVATESVALSGSSTISSATINGPGGQVRLITPRFSADLSRITASTAGAGSAGDLTFQVGTLSLTGGALIDSTTFGSGQGGRVIIAASEAMTLSGSGTSIASDTFGTGPQAGAAGRLTIMTPVLTMDGPLTIEGRTVGDAQGGNIEVQVERLTMTGGAAIGSNSGTPTVLGGPVLVGTGKAGQVTVTATDSITLTGSDSTGFVLGGILSQTFGAGDAGRVSVTTPRLTMRDQAKIGADTGGEGSGGDVIVSVGSMSLASGAKISSQSGFEMGGDQLFVGTGQGGAVEVTASEAVLATGTASGLTTSTAGQGRGGDITLHALRVDLRDGAIISAQSTGLGDAGNIMITTHDSFFSTNSRVVTSATQADGGNIQLTAPRFLRLRDSTISAAVGGGASTVGGNIAIDPQFVLLQNSQIRANAFAGRGGNIQIRAGQVFLADPASLVTASSALGIDGQVAIQAPVSSISGTLAPLSQAYARTTELLRNRCAERLRRGASRLLVGGRDGVPSDPWSGLPSPLLPAIPETTSRQEAPGETWIAQSRVFSTNERTPTLEQGFVTQPGLVGVLDVECARWVGHRGRK